MSVCTCLFQHFFIIAQDKDTADFLAHFFNEEFLKLMGPFKDLAITTTTQVDGKAFVR